MQSSGDAAQAVMDGEALRKIPDALGAVVDRGDRSGGVTLVWRRGVLARAH